MMLRTKILSLVTSLPSWVSTPGSTLTSKLCNSLKPSPCRELPILTLHSLFSLDYQNRKADYFKAIWEVINWKAAEKRFE